MSWPVAVKTAATMLAVFASDPRTPLWTAPDVMCWYPLTSSSGVVLRTRSTTPAGRRQSAATLIPRPSARAWAEAFLSPEVFPSMMKDSSSASVTRCGCRRIH